MNILTHQIRFDMKTPMFMTFLYGIFYSKKFQKNKNMVQHIYIKDGIDTLIKILEDRIRLRCNYSTVLQLHPTVECN